MKPPIVSLDQIRREAAKAQLAQQLYIDPFEVRLDPKKLIKK